MMKTLELNIEQYRFVNRTLRGEEIRLNEIIDELTRHKIECEETKKFVAILHEVIEKMPLE